jgi:hypothetical protein
MSTPINAGTVSSAHAEVFHKPRLRSDLVALQSQLFCCDVLYLFQDSLLNQQPSPAIRWNRLRRDGPNKVPQRRTSSRELIGPSCSHHAKCDRSNRESERRKKAAQYPTFEQEQNQQWKTQKQQEQANSVESSSRGFGEPKPRQVALGLRERLPTRPSLSAREHYFQGCRRSKCPTIDIAFLNKCSSNTEKRASGWTEPTCRWQSRNHQRRKVRHGANVRTLRVRQLDPEPILDLHHEFNAVETHAAMVSASADLFRGRLAQ